jgi:hypothetical protein
VGNAHLQFAILLQKLDEIGYGCFDFGAGVEETDQNFV